MIEIEWGDAPAVHVGPAGSTPEQVAGTPPLEGVTAVEFATGGFIDEAFEWTPWQLDVARQLFGDGTRPWPVVCWPRQAGRGALTRKFLDLAGVPTVTSTPDLTLTLEIDASPLAAALERLLVSIRTADAYLLRRYGLRAEDLADPKLVRRRMRERKAIARAMQSRARRAARRQRRAAASRQAAS